MVQDLKIYDFGRRCAPECGTLLSWEIRRLAGPSPLLRMRPGALKMCVWTMGAPQTSINIVVSAISCFVMLRTRVFVFFWGSIF